MSVKYLCLNNFQIPIGSDKILHVAALGQNFAVFRGQNSNEAYVLDAYCSHLGADLTAGGKVIGEVVQVCKLHKHSICTGRGAARCSSWAGGNPT